MSYAYQEDWVHVDEHWKQIEYLEEQVADLKLQVQGAEADEAYTLAQIYKALEGAYRANEWQSYQALMKIIQLHRQEVRDQAQQIIKSEV